MWLRSGRTCRLAVVELRARPLRGRVADRAVLREAGRHVVRIGGLLIVRQVASRALRGQSRVLARRRGTACRSTARAIRSGRTSSCCGRTSPRSIARWCGRRRSPAGIPPPRGSDSSSSDRSGRWQEAHCVDSRRIAARRVALGARQRHMRSRQRERGLRAVIELRPGPLRGGVAQRAILREARRNVVRVGRLLVVGQVARPRTAWTGPRNCPDEWHWVHATARALQSGRISSCRDRISPRSIARWCGRRAVLRESRRHVVRIGGLLIRGQMARGALRGQAGELPRGMALIA